MKKILLILTIAIVCTSLFATDYLTIYNNNQALFRTDIEMTLKKGVHFYSFENIPTGIITESVIFLPEEKNVQLFSQNFEYDLANSHKTIEKYINKNIRLTTEEGNFSGELIFFDGMNYGIQNNSNKELTIINASKVVNITFAELPSNFYTKPTLRWQLSSANDGKFKADLSYLTSGISWRATYNVILNKDTFTLNSWVTINNRSGKSYEDVVLKLIAGDVQTYNDLAKGSYGVPEMMMRSSAMNMAYDQSAPVFSEKEFADSRLYTLDKKASIENSQEKQLSLYPVKEVKYIEKYEYQTETDKVNIVVNFTNSKKAGLGVPLPKGTINFYKIDEGDKTNQFIGVATINHTSDETEVSVKRGNAFDIVAETITKNTNTSGKTRDSEKEIVLRNQKKEAVEIEVIHRVGNYGNYEILKPSIAFNKKDAFTYIFKVKVDAGKTATLSFTEKYTSR